MKIKRAATSLQINKRAVFVGLCTALFLGLPAFGSTNNMSRCEKILLSSTSPKILAKIQNFVSYLRDLLNSGVVTLDQLNDFLEDLKQGQFTNPIKDTETSSANLVAFEDIEQMNAQDIPNAELISEVSELLSVQGEIVSESRNSIEEVNEYLVRVKSASSVFEMNETIKDYFLEERALAFEYEFRLLLVKVASRFYESYLEIHNLNRISKDELGEFNRLMGSHDGSTQTVVIFPPKKQMNSLEVLRFWTTFKIVNSLKESTPWRDQTQFQNFLLECIDPLINFELLSEVDPVGASLYRLETSQLGQQQIGVSSLVAIPSSGSSSFAVNPALSVAIPTSPVPVQTVHATNSIRIGTRSKLRNRVHSLLFGAYFRISEALTSIPIQIFDRHRRRR